MADLRGNTQFHPACGVQVSDRVIAKLESGGLEQLTQLAIDHLLSVPLASLVKPEVIASQIAINWRQTARSDQSYAWVRAHVERLQATTPTGTLRSHLAPGLIAPIKEAIGRPVVPDRALVGRLLEHGAVEDLLRELLVGALQGFAKRLRPAVPGSDRAVGRLRSLKRVSEGMLGGLGAEIERQAEQKAKDFVDSILSSVVAQAADDLCDPHKAEDYGRFRAHLLEQLLDTPLIDLKQEADKLETDTLVDTVVEMAGAIAESDQLEDQISSLIQVGLDTIGDQSAGQLLHEAGVADAWRAEVEQQVNLIAKDFIKSTPFRAWLDCILSE